MKLFLMKIWRTFLSLIPEREDGTVKIYLPQSDIIVTDPTAPRVLLCERLGFEPADRTRTLASYVFVTLNFKARDGTLMRRNYLPQ